LRAAAEDGSRGVTPIPWQLGQQDLVGRGVALGDEPRAASGAVEPPLALHAGGVASEGVVLAELSQRGPRGGPPRGLTAVAEVGYLARAAVWAGEEEGHFRRATLRLPL